MSDTETLLAVEHLSAGYGQELAIDDVSFTVHEHEIVVLAGESGSGKSTVLKAVQGLLPAAKLRQGRIVFAGQDMMQMTGADRRRIAGADIGMVFQNAGASFCPIRRLDTQIYEAARAHYDWSKEEFCARARAICQRIDLPESALAAYPLQLSGGMGQRAGLLAAMIMQPRLLLGDEPTAALDAVTQVDVVQELMALRREQGTAMLIVTHHMGVAWYMADRIIIMRRGHIVESGTREAIFEHPQQEYTRELIATVPRLQNQKSA